MTELCEVVMTAPDPEWLKDFSRKLVEHATVRQRPQLRAGPVHLPMARRDLRAHRGPGVAAHQPRPGQQRSSISPSEEHPYEVPGISARPIIDGNPDYLAWIAAGDRATSRNP